MPKFENAGNSLRFYKLPAIVQEPGVDIIVLSLPLKFKTMVAYERILPRRDKEPPYRADVTRRRIYHRILQ